MPKIAKIAKKVDFSRGRFFDDFLDGQKIEKTRHATHRVISSPGPGLHWGTIGGTINQQPMNWLSNTPLGQRPGELYYYIIILLYYHIIILLYHYIIILLHHYIIILLYYYIIILLYYYIILLLYY